MDQKIINILKQEDFTREDIISLLNINNHSQEFYQLIEKANKLSRMQYRNKAYIFSQIGLNSNPCSMNCKFCSMAASNYCMDTEYSFTIKDITSILDMVKKMVSQGIHDLFLMSTADYPMEVYLKIAEKVRQILPDDIRLVANVGDFNLETAYRLKEAGFTGVYHIKRLREGIDTDIDPEVRMQTIHHIKESGLELYYCIEPIGPEHTYEEITEEILLAKELNVNIMAVMRRTPIVGTPLYEKGMITALELTKIAAVTRLVVNPQRSMNVHEVLPISLVAGINQLYAEAGSNPRDTVKDTSLSRGYSVEEIKQLFADAEYELA